MKESRWLRWVGPGLIATAAVGAVVGTATGAPSRPWVPQACPEGVENAVTARWAGSITLAEIPQQPWYRLDPRLDEGGTLVGQRLSFGLDRDRESRFIDLAPEAFAAGPFGRLVLAGADDGSKSHIEALDVARDCTIDVAEESDVIRRATIDPTGRTIYEMRVDRATRVDLGIWARPIDASAPPVRVLAPIPPDPVFGPTFSTEFLWDLSGPRLAVQSCGELACRTRIIDFGAGNVATVAEADLGTVIGLDGQSLIVYQACPGLPCPIVNVDVPSGERATITDAGSAAVLAAVPNGARVVHELFDGPNVRLRAVSLDGTQSSDLGTLEGDLRLQSTAGLADAATSLPDGWVLLSPDGRMPVNGPAGRVHLRHVTDGRTVQIQEVLR